MRNKVEQTMTWEEAEETIDADVLAKILAIGIKPARKIFKRYDFPVIPETENQPKADKEAARLYIQRMDFKNFPTEKIEYLTLMEIKKQTESLQEVANILKKHFSSDSPTIIENPKPNCMKGDEEIDENN